MPLGQGDGVLGNHGFASRRMRSYEYALVALEMRHCMLLKHVQFEWVLFAGASHTACVRRRPRHMRKRSREHSARHRVGAERVPREEPKLP